MPLPNYVISATAFICERILQEADTVVSAIRIVDVFYVPELPPDAPPGALPFVQAYGVFTIRTLPGHYGEHLLKFRLLNTQGEWSDLGPPIKTEIKARLDFAQSVPGGASAFVQLNIAARNLGTCYVCCYLDDEEMVRVPFTLMRPDAGKSEANA